jgi:hypothetical protein
MFLTSPFIDQAITLFDPAVTANATRRSDRRHPAWEVDNQRKLLNMLALY